MRNGNHNRIVRTLLGCRGQLDTVLIVHFVGINPGIMHINLRAVRPQFFDDVSNLGVPHVRAIFLERKTKNQDFRLQRLNRLGQHLLYHS